MMRPLPPPTGSVSLPPIMKTTKLLICAISVAAAVAASKAVSQTLPATLIEISPALLVNGTVNDGGYTGDFYTGLMRFDTFDGFCVEPAESLSYGESLVYQIQDPGLLANADTVARLVTAYLASPQTADHAAAVQWAIWEMTTEILSSPSLTAGNVRITLPAGDLTATLANQYLATAGSFAPANLTYLTNTGRQDVITWTPIPEPGTAALAALSALLLVRRRR
jgi:uncharacterized protein (TIGR03382 family)